MNLLLIAYSSEEEAQTALAAIDSPTAFVEVWNEVRSTPVVTDTDPVAQDIPWSTYEDVASRTAGVVADAAFELSESGSAMSSLLKTLMVKTNAIFSCLLKAGKYARCRNRRYAVSFLLL